MSLFRIKRFSIGWVGWSVGRCNINNHVTSFGACNSGPFSDHSDINFVQSCLGFAARHCVFRCNFFFLQRPNGHFGK